MPACCSRTCPCPGLKYVHIHCLAALHNDGQLATMQPCHNNKGALSPWGLKRVHHCGAMLQQIKRNPSEMHVPQCHYIKATSSLSTLIIFLFLIISVRLSHSSTLSQFLTAFPFLKYLYIVPRNLNLTLTTKPNFWFSFKSSTNNGVHLNSGDHCCMELRPKNSQETVGRSIIHHHQWFFSGLLILW